MLPTIIGATKNRASSGLNQKELDEVKKGDFSGRELTEIESWLMKI